MLQTLGLNWRYWQLCFSNVKLSVFYLESIKHEQWDIWSFWHCVSLMFLCSLDFITWNITRGNKNPTKLFVCLKCLIKRNNMSAFTNFPKLFNSFRKFCIECNCFHHVWLKLFESIIIELWQTYAKTSAIITTSVGWKLVSISIQLKWKLY